MIRLFPRILVVAVAIASAVPARSQELFAPAEPVPAPSAAVDVTADDPLVTQLRQRAASGNDAVLAEAVASLARIGRWGDVDEILARAATQERDPIVAADMARRIGPTLLIRMSRSDQLNEPAKQLVRELSAALAQANVEPETLRQAIADLAAANQDTRLAAIRVLYAGGEASVAELVRALVADDPPVERDVMLRVLLRLGEGGPQALRQFALYGNDRARARALAALARIDATAFTPDLVTALHAVDASSDEQQVATTALASIGVEASSRREAMAYLHHDLRRAEEAVDLAAGSDIVVTLWHLTPDRSNIESVRAVAAIAAGHQRANAAARLRRLGSLPVPLHIDALIADMSYRVMVDPLWGDPQQVANIRQQYGDELRGDALERAFGEALVRKDWPAVVGLLQLVDDSATPSEVSDWLRGRNGEPAPIVNAVLAPLPRVRYEAAAAIARLAPTEPYAGSSQVLRTFAEMSRLTNRPVVLLVETLPELVARQSQFLASLGYQVDVVASVGELEERIAAGGDLRLVLSNTGLVDARAIELVDRVRRLPRGELLPIIFYGESESVLGATSSKVPTLQIPQPLTPAPIGQIMVQWQAATVLPPLVESERTLFQMIAREALGIVDTTADPALPAAPSSSP